MARRRQVSAPPEVSTKLPTPAERAAAGAQWLDGVESTWYKKIKVNVLDVGSTLTCIVAQLSKTGTYDVGYLLVLGAPGSLDDPELLDLLLEFALLHGFRLSNGADGDDLTVAWAAEIAARKEK